MENLAQIYGGPCLGYVSDEHGDHFNQDKPARKSDGD